MAAPATPTFEQFFRSELLPELETLDERRRKLAKQVLLAGGVLLAIVIIIEVWVAANSGDIFWMILPVFGAIIIAPIAFSLMTQRFGEDFKHTIIRPIAQFVSPDLEYYPAGRISQARFEASGLFKRDCDRYRGEDKVQGRVGDTAIEFSEIHAEYKSRHTDSKGNTKTRWHTIFKGLFFIADFNKHFSGTTFVLPDTAERLFGRFGQSLQSLFGSHGELIKLENPEFERHFAVYASDQVEARYILSPALMQRILDFKNKANERIYLSFIRGEVNLGIASNKNRFEPRLFKSVKDIRLARQYLDDLQFALGIVDDLNLNTRIWTKN